MHFIGVSGDYYVNQLKKGDYTFSIERETQAALVALFAACRDNFVANFLLPRMIYASQILHHLLGHLFFNNRAFSPLLQSSRFRSIDSALSYLNEHMSEQLSLNDMVKHSGLSKSHFIRLFKEQTGHSPTDYFIQLKMQHACMLLAYRQDSIRQISAELGYQDQYYFLAHFEK